MRNAIVTLNIGSVFRTNARRSLEHAAARWNACLIELTAPLVVPTFYPSYNKFLLGRVPGFAEFERILFCDPDILINISTPNIFELSPSYFYAVRDGDRFAYDAALHSQMEQLVAKDHYSEAVQYCNWEVSETVYLNNFFNAGFFLFSPRYHSDMFAYLDATYERMAESEADFSTKNFLEQAIFNCVVQYFCKEKLSLLPCDWNFLEPPVLNGETTMERWVYHFTGPVLHKHKELIDQVDWTVPIPIEREI